MMQRLLKNDPAVKELASLFINVIAEACFLDPHYGVNKEMKGWKWVNHPYGKPRPDASSDYFALIDKWNEARIYPNIK